jgi:type II secretory pathway pseudopilin PulG
MTNNRLKKSKKICESSIRRTSERIVVAPRHAFTIVELLGTCFLLGVMFSMTVPMLLVVARERRSTEQRQFALQHAENLLEHAVSLPWKDIAIGELPIPDADSDLGAVLPGLERTLTVKQVDGERDALQIVALVRWQNATSKIATPIQLFAWVYPLKETP